MSFLTENAVVWRRFMLALLVVAMLGPWAFDMLNVPGESPCEPPVVRLYGDYCGLPMSGLDTIRWFGGGVSYTFGELMKGNFVSQIPELLFLIGIAIIVFPFLSNLLLIGNHYSDRRQTINMIAWGLASLAALTFFILHTNQDHFFQFFYLLWGLWLYILLAIGGMILEILVLRSDITPSIAA